MDDIAGLIGFVLAVFSIYAGYNEYSYWHFSLIAGLVGFVLYFFLPKAYTQLLVISQEGSVKAIIWIVFIYFAQVLTCSILYGIGRLFS